jgi:hypothetical protein
MSNENKVIIDGIEIDTEKVNRLLNRLIIKEKTNIKTKQLNDGQMVAAIKKMIEEEVECY